MTSRELFFKFESLESYLKRNQYLLDAIHLMSIRQHEVINLHSNSLMQVNDQPGTYQSVEITRKKIREIISEIKKLSPKRMFNEINDIVGSLTKTESTFDSSTTKKLDSLKNEFEVLGEEYEKFINGQQLGEAARLLSAAQRVDVAISSSIEFTSVVLKNLCPENEVSTLAENRLEIYLSSETDFRLFLEKTSALERIYEELCQLFKVSSAQEPLKIVKIESGSSWTWLTGNPLVVTTIIGAITTAAHFVYRNYTKEGKLGAIPKKVEKIESILHLSDELKKRGIETKDLDHHISKASVEIGGCLEKLLEGEDEIEVNGEVIPLTITNQQKLIGKSRIKLIDFDVSNKLTNSNPPLLDNPPK